jgi:hypothetical protein
MDENFNAKVVPAFPPLRNLTIVQHYHAPPQGPYDMYADQRMRLQMAAMQQRLLMESQNFVAEQMRQIKAVKDSLASIALEGSKNDAGIKAIEDKNEDGNLHKINHGPSIDASYEIISGGEDKIEEKNGMGIDCAKVKAEIRNSIERQIASNEAVPFVMECSSPGTVEGKILWAPVVFTVRNGFWRSRVRYIMQENYYDKASKAIIRQENQQNDNAVIVVFYNKKKEPVEILAVIKLGNAEEDYMYFSYDDKGLCKLVNTVVKIFDLGLKNFNVFLEPDTSNPSIPDIVYGNDGECAADLIKIKPVLSFAKKEQVMTAQMYAEYIRGFDLNRERERNGWE